MMDAVETYRPVVRRTRRRLERVAERVGATARLVEERGCITTATLMRELGLSHTKAYYALRLLQAQGRATEVVAGKIAIWCRDAETAEELMRRLKETVHRLVVANGIRHATPSKILRAALGDRDAYELLRALVPLSRRETRFHPVALAFVRDLLYQMYGEPLKYSNSKYVYIVKRAT